MPATPKDPGVHSIIRRECDIATISRIARLAGAALLLAAVPIVGAGPASASAPAGHVYVQTNDLTGNAVVVYERDSAGGLTFDEAVPSPRSLTRRVRCRAWA